MARYLPVMGTHGFRGEEKLSSTQWYHPESPHAKFMVEQGFDYIEPSEPFIWSSDLNGAGVVLAGDHTDWIAGGYALRDHLQPAVAPNAIPLADRNIIAHSHGLQVVAYALARAGLRINTLITVGSPIREDMKEIYQRMRVNLRYWLHLYSDKTDHMQWFGELFDGHTGIVRVAALADRNDFTPSVGHSGILFEPEDFHLWLDRGWLAVLKGQ